MLHAISVPSIRIARERGLAIVCLAFALTTMFAATASARQPRIASINVCTDQLLLALADPKQILGLSPYSRDGARSWAAAEASKYRKLSGEAEDVLMLKPDFVVGGRFTRRATRELLKDKGVKVIEFDIARSIDDVRSQIRKMGDLVGHPERAEREVARLDAAVARTKSIATQRRPSVLSVSRRGWVSGSESLITSLLAEVGLSNAAARLGIRAGGFASLESIVQLKPDLLLLSDDSNSAEDQGKAFLLHPALQRLYPPSRRLVLPERLTVCGGPMLAEALDRLSAELRRVAP